MSRDLPAVFGRMSPAEINAFVARSRAWLVELAQGHSTFETTADLDPLPLRLSVDEGRLLARGAAQWGELLTRTYHGLWAAEPDLIPDQVLWETSALDPGFFHLLPDGPWPLGLIGLDLTRHGPGAWSVQSVVTGVPQGLGFALENRILHKRVYGSRVPRAQISRLAPFFKVLKDQWQTAARSHRDEPSVMVWTAGPLDRHYFEHVYLARYFGYPLVESRDLTVRSGKVFLKLLGGLQNVDVLVRMVSDPSLDPLSGAGSAEGVAGLLGAVRDGAVVVVNAPGSDLLGQPAVFPYYWQLAQRFGLPLDLAPSAGGLRETELFWMGEAWEPREVLLRIFAARTPSGWELLPGGLAQTPGGSFKDVWVAADRAVPFVTLLPQQEKPSEIHRWADLPSRVADDLHWLGRYAERAWVDLRFLERWWETHETGQGDEGGDAATLNAVVDRLELRPDESSNPDAWRLWDDLSALEGISRRVRDRLSLETHRIIGRFASLLNQSLPFRERFDQVALFLAALTGLTQENLTRGPGWLFLDLGRRIERAALVADAARAFLDLRPGEEALGLLLDLFDSGLTYRTRYRLAPQLGPVLDLLLLDETNPRSLAFQLARLAELVAQLPRGDRKAYRSGEERAVLDLLTRVRLSDAGGWTLDQNRSLRELLSAVDEGLNRLGDALQQSYLAKVEVALTFQSRQRLE